MTKSAGALTRPISPKLTLWSLVLIGALTLIQRVSSPAGGRLSTPNVNECSRAAERDAKETRVGPNGNSDTTTEPGRGREAQTPSEIPVRGWKDILWRTYEEISNDRVLAVAAGVTFYTLLAIFPAIAAFVSLYGLFADAGTINHQLASLSGLLPGGAVDIIGDQVKRIASKPHGSLGLAFFFGLAVSLWSANAGMKSMFDALNVVYGEKEKRGFIALNARSLAFTVGAMFFLVVAIAAVVVLPLVLQAIGLGWLAEWAMTIARWPLLLAVTVAGLAVLYRYGPSRQEARWGWITWGSGIAAVAWLAASMLFSWYVSSFSNYNETYGSLGAAIGFMTWMWLSATIILIGAEINAEMEHQTAKDTTEGPEKAIGTRGASMADEVGDAAG